jgi:putative methyltransferase
VRNLYLFQPQYAVELRAETNYWLPYSAGCLWSYASQFEDIQQNWHLAGLAFQRDPVDIVISGMEKPDICGFSCYLWNERYCLELARRIKQRWPEVLVVFGGAQASGRMLEHDFIDVIIMREGEESFLKILRDRQQNKTCEHLISSPRLQDLDIPSPYLTGVFDDIIERNPNAVWAMTLETNRGCPYACTFCDWGGVTYSKIKRFGLEKVAAELEWATKHRVAYIFCADANFGIFRERDLEIAKIMRQAAESGEIESINLQYAKNSTASVFEIAQAIGEYGRGITVSVQSMHDDTLEAIRRDNLGINDIGALMRLSQISGVRTYTEMILGLPKETWNSWCHGICQLLEVGQHNSIDIWFLQLLENSELATIESRQRWQLDTVTVQDYIALGQERDEIPEFAEIVRATNTLTRSQLIDCYMYAWMIVQMHVTGYTQIVARYGRNLGGIGYRCFYDSLWKLLPDDPVLGDHYHQLRSLITEYLENGRLNNGIGGHALHVQSYQFLYDRRRYLAALALQTMSELTWIAPGVENLQSAFVVDISNLQDEVLHLDFDVIRGVWQKSRYHITTRYRDPAQDFYTIRRKGSLKNDITIYET